MLSTQVFQDDSESKLKMLSTLIESGKYDNAAQYIKDNPIHVDNALELLGFISGKTDHDSFVELIDELLSINKESWAFQAIIDFILDDFNKDNHYLSEENVGGIIGFLAQYGYNQKDAFPRSFSELLVICYKEFTPETSDGLFQFLLDEISDENKSQLLMQAAIEIALSEYNSNLLHSIRTSEIDQGVSSRFSEIIEMLPKDKKVIAKNLLVLNQNESKETYQLMSQFSHHEFGKIQLDGALLTCAQVASRKPYVFEPTILEGIDEFKDYLKTLKDFPLPDREPHRERFVLSGLHWITGDISIAPNGKVSVVFIDSLGIDKIQKFDTEKAIKEFTKIFPESNIYFPNLTRLNGSAGCSVFALDDLRHLHTIEHGHLEKRFNTSGLFGYLEASAKSMPTCSNVESKNDYTIIPCELPLPFMRTLQSTRLYAQEIESRSDEEKAVPAKKVKAGDRETTSQYAQTNFFKKSKHTGLLQNVRLEETLEKMAKFNLAFLSSLKYIDAEALQSEFKPFTLEGFKERLQNGPVVTYRIV